ncbi:electron transport complex subunit RsxG [Magnetospira thiophila]
MADEPKKNPPGLLKTLALPALMLGVFALAAAASLAFVDDQTRGPIAERQAKDLKASLIQVVPADLHDNDLLEAPLTLDGRTVYRGTRDGTVTALAYEMQGFGYGGEIRVLVGLDPSGRLLGARVLKHAETPGLGDKIEAAKDGWILQFAGLSLGQPPREKWRVKKDGGQFDQFSGATITPRAVVAAIRQGLDYFETHKSALLEVGS